MATQTDKANAGATPARNSVQLVSTHHHQSRIFNSPDPLPVVVTCGCSMTGVTVASNMKLARTDLLI